MEWLNINQNRVLDIRKEIIDRLLLKGEDGSLKKNRTLQSLFVNLSKEEEVEYLLKMLAGLKYLNGLDVDRDELEIQEEQESEQPPESSENVNADFQGDSEDHILNVEQLSEKVGESDGNKEQNEHLDQPVDIRHHEDFENHSRNKEHELGKPMSFFDQQNQDQRLTKQTSSDDGGSETEKQFTMLHALPG